MPTISCESKCSEIYQPLVEYIKYYSEKFARWVTESIDPSPSGGSGSEGSGSSDSPNPISVRYNATLYELNEIGNKLIPYIGGTLLPKSYQEDSDIIGGLNQGNLIPNFNILYGINTDIEELEILESSIVNSVKDMFSTIFTDFTYKNSNLTASEAWIDREGDYGTEKASYYKVKSIGMLDQCNFLDIVKSRLISGKTGNYSTLDIVKEVLNSFVDYIQTESGYVNQLGQRIINLDNFYHNVTMDFSRLALYASSGDYISHQYYTDEGGWSVLGNWESTVRDMIQRIENRVPVLIENQSNEILSIIEDIRAVGEELKDNKSIQLLEELNELVNSQYLSHYIEGYGYKLAQIIREMMLGVDRDTYDYHLIDKLTLIEQKLQQSLMNSTNRMNVHSSTAQSWGGTGGYREQNKNHILGFQNLISNIENHQGSI